MVMRSSWRASICSGLLQSTAAMVELGRETEGRERAAREQVSEGQVGVVGAFLSTRGTWQRGAWRGHGDTVAWRHSARTVATGKKTPRYFRS